MKLECFLYPGWRPRIRPASRRREWMDETPESFAYRCLPLAIANAHGWEIGNAVGFSARWNGGRDVTDVEIVLDDPGHTVVEAPVSLFGQGTLTFHVAGLFRTEPGWNLWIGGPPNQAKDGIAPLSGIIETDWSPYSFTMNWRFTRPGHWVRFEPDEAIAFFFLVSRRAIEATEPSFHAIEDAPELKAMFEAWSISRDAFHRQMRETPPQDPAEKWQKLYYRGIQPDGQPGASDHQIKLRPQQFVDRADPAGAAPSTGCPINARSPSPPGRPR
ncbi:DUF6065 family protein [Sphingomonas sp.]|uniref:DUF6065 family protein n=1 Tax=Sphingomonas sp. TaxID=28214 RepID=UPI0025EF8098|nr:DUF6065 family protein [Sphingomonas sp.]